MDRGQSFAPLTCIGVYQCKCLPSGLAPALWQNVGPSCLCCRNSRRAGAALPVQQGVPRPITTWLCPTQACANFCECGSGVDSGHRFHEVSDILEVTGQGRKMKLHVIICFYTSSSDEASRRSLRLLGCLSFKFVGDMTNSISIVISRQIIIRRFQHRFLILSPWFHRRTKLFPYSAYSQSSDPVHPGRALRTNSS